MWGWPAKLHNKGLGGRCLLFQMEIYTLLWLSALHVFYMYSVSGPVHILICKTMRTLRAWLCTAYIREHQLLPISTDVEAYGGPLGPFRSHFGVRRLELAVSGICSSHAGVLLQPFSSSSLGVSRFRYML